MSVVTETVIETSTDIVNLSSSVPLTTTTERYQVTVVASHGQTITVNSPLGIQSALPTSKYTPTSVPPSSVSTITVTELDIYLQDTRGNVYSTWAIPISSSAATSASPPGQLAYVVDPAEGGWESWPRHDKAGLIAGVVLIALFLLTYLICCCNRRGQWITHEWGRAGSFWGQQGPAHSTVPMVTVAGPLDPTLASPYGYARPGCEYGLRGGGVLKSSQVSSIWQRLREPENTRMETERASEQFEPVGNPREGIRSDGLAPMIEGDGHKPAFYRPPVSQPRLQTTG